MSEVRHFTYGSALLAVVGLVVGPNLATGQEIRPAPSEEIVVVAPYLVHKNTPAGTNFRTPIYSISVERKVTYADLDLGTSSGATELQKRVDDAAKEACAELDRRYPTKIYAPITDDTGHCVEIASKDAQAKVQELIAAAYAQTISDPPLPAFPGARL